MNPKQKNGFGNITGRGVALPCLSDGKLRSGAVARQRRPRRTTRRREHRSRSERCQVFCHGGPSGNCQRPLLADQDDNHNQHALAKAERQKMPFGERFTERPFLSARSIHGSRGLNYRDSPIAFGLLVIVIKVQHLFFVVCATLLV